jgi:Icc-related predicted phosphoesterase
MYHQWLDEIFERAGKPEKFILVTHQPPYQTTTDKAMKLVHTGSRAIREFIERTQPVLCLCGHIHESAGTDRIGNTLIINPGPFKKGQYAFISINDQQIDIELK